MIAALTRWIDNVLRSLSGLLTSSERLTRRANRMNQSAIIHRDIHNAPPIVTGSGDWLTEKDTGRKVFDASCGAAVSCLGHTRIKEVKDAIARAEDQSPIYACYSYSTAIGEEFAQWLIDSTNGNMEKVVINSSGSDAMETVVKIATDYHRSKPNPQERVYFISRDRSYHGATGWALALSGHKKRRSPWEFMISDKFHHVSACDEYNDRRAGETMEAFNARLAADLEKKIVELGEDKVVGFVAEPIVGAGLGCAPATPGYFKAIGEVCDRYGVLLIFDEVMCGMGRCGTLHAWQQEGVVPDLQAVGKGLAGGYEAASAVLVGKKVARTFRPTSSVFLHGYTYQNHPRVCAAALAVQRYIQDHNLLDNVNQMGRLLGRLLKEKLGPNPHVGSIQGKALFWGIGFVLDKETKQPFPGEENIAGRIQELGKAWRSDFGIHLYAATGTVDGDNGDHLIVAPAYNIDKQRVEFMVDTIADVIHHFFAVRFEAQAQFDLKA